MANQELTLKDPFKGTGNYVCGERFVGRNELVQRLRRNCTRQNYSIQGLPHTGKTSLVKHSIHDGMTSGDSGLPVCIAYVSVDTCETRKDFYKSLVNSTYKAIKEKLTDSKERDKIEAFYQDIKDCGFDKTVIVSQFEQNISTMNVCLILIYDRFDYVKKLEFDWHDFSRLTAFVSADNIKCVAVSISSISKIEEDLHGKDGGSVFSQLFISTTIVLEQYSSDDMKAYWERLMPYYDAIGLPLDDDYKKTAIYYAGRNPFLLDTYNNLITQLYQETRKQPSPEDLRIAMRRIYNSHIKTLERNYLLDMAIQVILGPISIIDKDKEDKMDLLKQYDFLRVVDEKEKRTLIGHDLGLVEQSADGKGTIAYAAPSDYFTLLFKNDYSGTADFWKEWSATFRSLQLLCKDFLEAKWGDNWFDHVEEDAIRQMLDDAKIDKNANITVSPLIEYLRESSIGKLIDKYWETFASVFEPIGQHTFKEHYNYVKGLRNHHAHNNTRFLSENDKAKANEYLEEIGRKVNAWYQSKKKLIPTNVRDTDAYTSTPPTRVPICSPIASASSPTPVVPLNMSASKSIIATIVNDPKPDINLGLGEYLGKIYHKTKGCVNIQGHNKTTWTKIDKKEGYRNGFSIKEIDYQEGKWVVCKLKEEIMPEGKRFYYVIDIHPV